jgi:heme exporter protein D
MNWASASDFFAMGGYGLFVWGSYGAALVMFVLEPWLTARRHRQALQAAREVALEDGTEPASPAFIESVATGGVPGAAHSHRIKEARP